MGSAREGPIDSLSDLEERFRGSGNKSPKGESFASIHNCDREDAAQGGGGKKG